MKVLENIGEVASMDEGSQGLTAGVYTTFRTYEQNKVLRLNEHFDRLDESANLQGYNTKLDRSFLQESLRQIANTYSEKEIRLRIHWSLDESENSLFFMSEEFSPYPPPIYANGVTAVTVNLARKNPLSKATDFINSTSVLRTEKPSNIHEYLMVSQTGEILEGLTSNVFCVANGRIHTADEGILHGITRNIVLEAIDHLRIPITTRGLDVGQVSHVQEVFLTSVSRGIMPVTSLNGQKIGSGKPGSVNVKVSEEYLRIIQSELQIL
jgi:branched-chain amino acid aminotransferase